ncbi:ATP-binding protein [Selenihalanaerobacter shriftii]|uniref:AAA+ ATPase domain-containing protein n=1 Tax=Selenihalanaerobacter shriftii TaxID=142842 RepID=A0A1T4NG10_9FIRM|nr:DUF815 domain-containing protein [Selenihalanaerobacter shriftii]SJZ78053.1 hypothetical protein SAMN02745118_01798 [Selenihalanaerobacter shriftii]
MSYLDQLKNQHLQLNQLVIYRKVLQDKLIQKFVALISKLNDPQGNITEIQNNYYEICYDLINTAERMNFKGDLWQNHLLHLVATDLNPFTLTSEKLGNKLGKSLREAATHDLIILKEILNLNLIKLAKLLEIEPINFIIDYESSSIKEANPQNIKKLKKIFSQTGNEKELVQVLAKYHYSSGAGALNNHVAFSWDNQTGLVGIKDHDPIRFEDLIGYEKQKEELIKNTERFIKGKRANNILLYGDSGTGKSSSVKALLNKYAPQKLRLVEITKEQMDQLPKILDILRHRGMYFILFMDDLSFEDFETDYKYLKAVIEGGIEVKPKNVLFYATSNRRHLIKEKWIDRDQESGEIHLNDAIQEKLSLVERFGITIRYESPNQKDYLRIVKELAQKHQINLSDSELENKAKQWAMRHNGRSGRTVQQFINHYS